MQNISLYKVSFSPGALLLIFIATLAVTVTNNVLYAMICLVTLVFLMKMIWRYNRPGILVFAFAFQWIQVATFVVWMNIRSRPLDFLSPNAPVALISSCVGLILMAFILSRVINRLTIYSQSDFEKQARKVNEKKILGLYLFSTVFLSSIGFVFGNTSGFAQVLVTISSLKWVFFMWYGYIAWINKKNRIIIILILIYEFTSGLYSYFSTFKEVFFYSILVSLTFLKQITFRQFVNFMMVGGLLVGFFLTWTVIKGDYRKFLSGGQRQQVVTVSQSEALSELGSNVTSITSKDYELSLYLALYRIQYILHMSLAMDRIPEVMPYEEGQVWWENISFVFTPRIFFPDKPIYEATKKTNKYTGMRYAGIKQGASFSLGYFTDGYVDFGHFGMFIPLVFIALFVSLIYRTFYRMENLNLFLRFAIINVCLYNFIYFESDGLFLFGRLLTNFVVYFALCKTVFPFIQKWLYQ